MGTLETINELYSEASGLAITLVEKEARKILFDDPALNEFVMAMGSCFFTTTTPGRSEILEEDDMDCEEFFVLVSNLNEQFNILGYPMRFTATGDVIRDW